MTSNPALAAAAFAPAEGRAFAERRVVLYLALVGAIWTGTWAFDRIVCALVHDDFWLHMHASSDAWRAWAHGGMGPALLALAAVLHRRPPAARALAAVEVTATLVQIGAFVAMMADAPATVRPDLVMLLGTAHILVLRAALVPARPRGTAALALLASVLVGAATYAAYTRGAPAPFSSARPPLVGATLWGAVCIVGTTALSYVIYGLRERVRAAVELGQYTLLEKIGEGGMGVVYRARHALLRRPTAVKVLPAERAGDASLARFEREVQLTAQIAHPNVVSVYDFGRSPSGAFYYAMEFLDGMDL